MKRSEINDYLAEAKLFFQEHRFLLPAWADRAPRDWSGRCEEAAEIATCQLGWDVTDFGSGDYLKTGLLAFTLRNGNPAAGYAKPYAEKIMVVRENQQTPTHFHWSKAEDIINRGGGVLLIDLWNSTPDEEFAETPVEVMIDGEPKTVPAGGQVALAPGQSICLTTGLYHRFYGQPGKGLVLVGEVSAVNDDATDNRFCPKLPRFPEIDEDAEPLHLLCGEYEKWF